MSPGLSAGAVARRLGVAVTTLRTWHQRYGLGPSLHEPGQHRRYTQRDVARLEFMQRLITTGIPPGEAARWAKRLDDGAIDGSSSVRSAGSSPASTPLTLPLPLPASASVSHPVATSPMAQTSRAGAPRAGEPRPGEPRRGGQGLGPGGQGPGTPRAPGPHRNGGGLALGSAHPAARGLGRAAMRLDGAGVRQSLLDSVAQLGVISTWDLVITPVLVAIGNRHAARGDFIDVEHLVSGCISDVLGAVPRPGQEAPARILLACADEEQHSLPLEALAAALAEAGAASRTLGARVPKAALTTAVRRTGPAAVLVWSQDAATASADQLSAIIKGRWRPLLIAAAGPGWDAATLPPDVMRPGSLQDAVDLLLPAAKH